MQARITGPLTKIPRFGAAGAIFFRMVRLQFKPISMMSANINIAVLLWVTAAFAFGTLIGFSFRSRQISKSKRRILELETEMVDNHAEILRLHKYQAEKKASSGKVPVISMPVGEASATPKAKAKA